LDKFNSLSKLQKEELTQILTDAFLTNQNLQELKYKEVDSNKKIEGEQPIVEETKDKKSYMRVASPRISAVTTISGSLQDFKKAVGLTKKEINTANQNKINKEIEKYNAKNGTSYYVKYKQLGQSTLVTYEILNKSPLDRDFNVDKLANDLNLDKKCN
jgi:vacuolar-type H+-ATPase catalytic subunit A/Vma1